MVTSATKSHGTLLKRGNGATPEVFLSIAELTSIGGIDLTQEILDVTNFDSTNAWREKIGGLLDAGSVAIDMNFLPGNATQSAAAGLVYDMTQHTKRNFQILLSDALTTTWSFTALVAKFTATVGDVAGSLKASSSLTITGEPTLT